MHYDVSDFVGRVRLVADLVRPENGDNVLAQTSQSFTKRIKSAM